MGVLYLSTAEPIDDLIAAAQADASDNSPAMAEILRRFEKTTLSIARSLTRDWHDQQDAAQGARLGLIKAVRGHTPGTAGFPSYARRYMRGAALRMITSTATDEVCVDLNDTDWADRASNDAPSTMTVEFLDLVKGLAPEQQLIVLAHYVADVRLGDLARGLGISTPAVSQRLATIHRALRPVVEGALAA